MRNTHAKSHSNYAVDIVQIFKVSRQGEPDRFRQVKNMIMKDTLTTLIVLFSLSIVKQIWLHSDIPFVYSFQM